MLKPPPVSVEIFCDHENRLTFKATGLPDVDWMTMKQEIEGWLREFTKPLRPMSTDEQNARAFAQCERSYLEGP